MILGNSNTSSNSILDEIVVKQFSSYNKIKFGNSLNPCTISQIYGLKEQKTREQLENYDFRTIPVWNEKTYMLALFDGSLQSGNLVGFDEEIRSFLLYREDNTNGTLNFIGELSPESKDYTDYTCVKDKTYRYYVIAKGDTKISSPAITNFFYVDYFGFFLIDEASGDVYVINSTPSGGDRVFEYGYEEIVGNTKYKSFNMSPYNFNSGTIGGIVSDASKNIPYKNDKELIDKLQDFVYDKTKDKILKLRDGSIFNVFIKSFVSTPLSLEISEPISNVSISWTEKKDVL